VNENRRIKSEYTPRVIEAIVDGLRYDVNKSEFIADLLPGWFTIYKTTNDRYFITRNKTESIGFDILFRWDYLNGVKNNITPMSHDEIIDFLQKHKRFDIIEKHFSSYILDA